MAFVIGTPHTSGSGYFCNDDTPSGGRKAEADIRTCSHCQAIIKMQEWKNEGGWCNKCNSPVCGSGPCAERTKQRGCEPFIKQIERALEADFHKRQFRKIAGI